MAERVGSITTQKRTATRATKASGKTGPASKGKKATESNGTSAQRTVSPQLAGEFAEIRKSLEQRKEELHAEHDRVITEMQRMQEDQAADSAGDDQADTGNQTFEREQELALANGILERVNQVEQALSRLDAGTYGQCERCGNQIPKARLEAFPAATLCVTCKQREERR